MGSNQIVQLRPGWSMLCHPVAYGFAYHLQNDDPEQVAEFDQFIAACRPEMVLFDIGSHFGVFSLAALRYGGKNARAIAVDPSPTAARIVTIQARLNNVSNRLTMVQASVGAHCGTQNMVAAGVLAAGYYVSPSGNHSGGELTSTREVTLDSLAEEFGTIPSHIKVDVEGLEVDVLRGGKNVLLASIAPLLFLELHNQMIQARGGDPVETLILLRDFGYKFFGVDGGPLNNDRILASPLIRIIAKRPE
ncbi:MAG: FkbM family methyltransferase [Blastocatellia bacterium]